MLIGRNRYDISSQTNQRGYKKKSCMQQFQNLILSSRVENIISRKSGKFMILNSGKFLQGFDFHNFIGTLIVNFKPAK